MKQQEATAKCVPVAGDAVESTQPARHEKDEAGGGGGGGVPVARDAVDVDAAGDGLRLLEFSVVFTTARGERVRGGVA